MRKSNILSRQEDYNASFQDNQDMILFKLEFLTALILEGITMEGKKKALLMDIW